MKTIFIARHASTKPPLKNQHDSERPLTVKGHDEAQWLGQFISNQSLPSLILTSSATRARQTSGLIRDILSSELSIDVHPELYLASPLQVLKNLKSLPTTLETLVLIGHNPGLSQFLHDISGPRSQEAAMNRIYGGLPPAGLAIVECQVDNWSEISKESTKLLNIIHPGE
ncbi:SixA phosphatase family protein [Kiloniella antarctica]|uniref:SixA phosphatase family protein n=1 Tax=Kiloniella antarctica TaxID=1550907 RepID=A0ABW5BNQ5_9PROT